MGTNECHAAKRSGRSKEIGHGNIRAAIVVVSKMLAMTRQESCD